MDNRKISSNPSPRESANFLSRLTWAWTFGLFKKGYRKILGVEDLCDPIPADRSNLLGDRLEKHWLAEVEKAKRRNRKPSLLRAILRTFSYEIFILAIGLVFLELFLRLGIPKLLGAFLQYFKVESETTFETALYFAIGIAVASLLNVIVIAHYSFFGSHVGAKIRIGICSLVYRKALRLSCSALSETAPGKIVNLVASDVNRFNLVFIYFNYLWGGPISSIIIFVTMYLEIGWSVLVGFILLFLDVPFQSYMGKVSSKLRLQTSVKTDERVRLMDEIISGVQVIKMYAWEKPFCSMIELARRLELRVVRKSAYIKGVFMTLFAFTTRMALYGTLITMMLRGQPLFANKVFVYMYYFNLMAMTMSYMFVRGIFETSECRVALKRLQNFLLSDEFTSGNLAVYSDHIKSDTKHSNNSQEKLELHSLPNGNNKVEKSHAVNWSVKLNHISAKWDLNSTETTLNDINLEIDKGKLYIVIGTVGAGKSSLIASILGELKLTQGSKQVNGRVSYASQDAWVFASSVRQNIIFGQEFDKKRYKEVVKVCALQKDFEQFPQGDHTMVGEKGSSLSGGQKARINLARAVYRESDIYLLDDPLSAVDAHVSKHLFDDCIQKYLANKTRILATHQLQYIKQADAIILLDQRKLYRFANYNELLNNYPDYANLIAEENVTDSDEPSSHVDRRLSSASGKNKTTDSKPELVDAESIAEENDTNDDDFYESTSRGTVKGSLLVNYMKSSGSIILPILIPFLFLATQFCISLNDWFIPVLVNEEETRYYMNDSGTLNISTTNKEEDMLSRDHYMYIYTAIVFSILLVGLTRSFTFYTVCLKCSQRLHDLVFSALIRAPMRFFDTNPSGRILNRFSKDLGSVDELLPLTLLDATQCNLIISGALLITCTVNIFFAIPILLIGGLFILARKIYLKTSKNMKRVEGITRAPIFTHLNATLNGITTIRAYQAESILEKEFDRYQDSHISAWYMFNNASAAFGFYLDLSCFVFTVLVTFSSLLLRDSFSGGGVGLAINQIMSLAGWLQWGIRQSAEVTNELMSVERVLEYTKLEPEPNLRDKGMVVKKKRKATQEEVPLIEPLQGWPANGKIEFKNVSLRYSDEDEPVLKNLTLTIQPSEKVGIVGRTGAGKSSLISALFRLAKVENAIEIDGIDTGTLALEDLRKNISIIPQDPVLFSGTLRRNLDPFNEFSDEHLWNVLEEVELKDAVKLTGNGLDYRVQDRGANYSTGQRQLICLARAILRNNRILMLDEATANVDPHTDALIQRTIRTKFAPCTVLTVAHRLNTIMDSDKVLVMDKGRLLEFNHPNILLETENSSFSSLVKETGPAMHEQLKNVAREHYKKKFS